MTRRRNLLALPMALALVVTACGGDDDDATPVTEGPAATDTPAEATADDTTETAEDTAVDDTAADDTAAEDTAEGTATGMPGLIEEGKLIVATTGNFPPFTAINPETGENEGYTIDIVREVANRLGLELELPTVDFVAELEGLSQGLYDIADSGIWPRPERLDTFSFSRPMTSAGIIAQVRAEDVDSPGFDDVSGLDVGAIQGSTHETYVIENEAELGYASYSGFAGAGEALTALKQGRVDVLAQDSLLATFVAEGDPELAVAGPVVEAHPLAFAFQKEQTPKRDAFDVVLNEMIEDGTLAEVQKAWFGRCIPVPEDNTQEPPYETLPSGDC